MVFGIIAIVLWIGSLIGFIIWNLLKKNRELERIVINQSEFVNETVVMLDQFNGLVNKIDMTMWVQSDPELLQLFETIKQIQHQVQEFTGRK
jgi:hypothetical protein